MKRIVILGGGVAGLRVAVALSGRLPKHAITLVDQREQHELPYALSSSTQSRQDSARAFRSLVERFKCTYIRGVVQRMHVSENVIALVDRQVPYDYAVLALGSKAVTPSHYALPASTIADRERIRHAIVFAVQRHRHASVGRPITIAVVGGGLAGVEMTAWLIVQARAAALEYGMATSRVRVACYERLGRVLPAYGHAVSRIAERAIAQLGVQVECHKTVVQVEEFRVIFEDGEESPADVVVWTGTWQAQQVMVAGGALSLGVRGQVLVNSKFQVHALPHVFCVGDQASPPFPHRHGAVQEILAESEYVASILPQIIQNRRVPAYNPIYHAEYIPLHQGNALRLQDSSATTGLLARLGLRREKRRYKKLLGM